MALDRFSTDVKLWSLLKRTININYIDLVRPDIHITQQGSSFNFDDMVAHFRSDSTAVEKPSVEKNPWIIDIDSITIRSGKMLYEDRQVEPSGTSITSTSTFRVSISRGRTPTSVSRSHLPRVARCTPRSRTTSNRTTLT